MTLLLLLALLAVDPAEAVCPADSAVLASDIQAASKAYDDWAWQDFDAAMVTVRTDLACLIEVVPKTSQAEVHRLFALAGARNQNAKLSEAAFRGLLAINPTYQPDSALAPEGSLLRSAFDHARIASTEPSRPLPAGAWFLDGRPSASEIPGGRAALVQLSESTGAFHSWYVDGGELPEALAARMSPMLLLTPTPDGQQPAEIPPDPLVPPSDGHGSRGLLYAGIATMVVGAGGLVLGEVFNEQMWRNTNADSAHDSYKLGLVSTLGGVGLGAVGSGLVVGAIVRHRW